MAFETFSDIMGRLSDLGMFHMDLRLERMHTVLGALAPKRPPAVVQIVGTNGKGSTATFLASLAAASGLRVGLFTSPHLANVRERIRLYDGGGKSRLLDEGEWLAPANAVMAAGGECLTYFEFLTVLASRVFSDMDVDVAVFEAGLGGTHDATTSLEKDILCITPVELDHESVLGHTPEAVALDKSGAMRPGVPVFSATQAPGVSTVIRDAAARLNVPLTIAPPVASSLHLGLTGGHQLDNAGLAVAAWRHMAQQHGWPCDEARMEAGLAHAWLPGRLHRIPALREETAGAGEAAVSPRGRSNRSHPGLIIDGAHNAHGLRALQRALEALPPDEIPRAFIYACMADKDLDAMLPLVRGISHGCPVYLPPVQDCERAMPPQELARLVGRRAQPVPSLAQAIAAAYNADRNATVLLFGSLYLTGEFYTLYPEYLNAAVPE